MAVHVRFQQTFPLRIPEWIEAAIMTCLGLMVLVNPGMFEQTPSFNGMAQILPQEAWGIAALILGMLGLVALAINGFWKATPFIRAMCAFARCFVWLQIIFGLMLTGIPTTGLVVYPWLLILDVWNINRATADARAVTR